MLIRSQDKKTIVNMDSISTIYLEGGKIKAQTEKGFIDVGSYYGTTKGMKVLDMLCEDYLDGTCVFYDPENKTMPHALQQSKVFQMPQDCEV